MAKKIEKLNIVELCDLYGRLLTKKQEDMLRLFYDYDNSLSEIAEQYNITRQAVHDCILKAEEQLLSIEEKLNLHTKVQKIEEVLTEVQQKLTDSPEVVKKLGEVTTIIYGD